MMGPERVTLYPTEYYDMDGGFTEVWQEEYPDDDPLSGGVEYIRADLAHQWQPIETTPRETEVLVWGNNQSGVYLAINNGGWWVADVHPYEWTELIVTPTHWMPLPSPPTT